MILFNILIQLLLSLNLPMEESSILEIFFPERSSKTQKYLFSPVN